MKKYQLLKMLQLSILILGVAMTTGCNSGSHNNSSSTQSNVENVSKHKLKDDFYILQPGAGYDTSTNTAVSDQSCLVAAQSFDNLYISNPAAFLHEGDQVALGKLQDKLGVMVSGDMAGGVFSGSMRADYMQHAVDNHYKLNMNYMYQYAGTVADRKSVV